MKHLRRVVIIILLELSLFIPITSRSQNLSEYSLVSDGTALVLIPRPDLGYVIQSNEQETAKNAFLGMLSSAETIESKSIKGLNNRNFTVVMNSDESLNSTFDNMLQSQNQNSYKAPLFSANGQTIAVIPEIVVRLAFEEAFTNLESFCNAHNLSIKQKLAFTQKEFLIQVHGSDADSVFDAIDEFNKNIFIEWAVPNIASQIIFSEFNSQENDEIQQVIPDDEYFINQWHLHNTGQTNGTAGADVNVADAWTKTTGDPNIIIAIIDTGIDMNHPDLINNIVPGYDFFEDDNDPSPDLQISGAAHGTACAGLAAAQGNNLIGVSGVAWNCKIMPIRIADYDNFISDADIATAIRWAAQNNADILSNSWGAYYPSQTIYSAILDVTRKNSMGRNGKGCIVCFAAGNWEEGGPVDYPAARPEVIAVGATDHDDKILYYSASGPELDIVAPSGAATRGDHFFSGLPYLWTTDITGIYGYGIENIDTSLLDYIDSMNGTSGACPLVAGVAALILSVEPNLTNIEVRSILLDSAHDLGVPGKDDYYGFGRVDANSAVMLALNPPETPASSDIILFVDDDAPGDPCANNPDYSDPNEDGTSMHPFDSIQEAINYAISTETIVVLPGTYSGNGNYNIDFSGKSIKLKSESGPETCIIDCESMHQGINFYNGEGQEAEIEGFTIKNGKAFYGAGIICENFSSPTITNCIIENCFAFAWGYSGGSGGGISIDSSCSPVIKNCIFKNNTASFAGGAVDNYGNNPTFTNCKFMDNLVGENGAAICMFGSSATFINCLFSGNLADYEGGAMYIEDSIVSIENCTFSSNYAYYGNGIACDYYYSYYGLGSELVISNSIMHDGTDSIKNYDASDITISYSNVQKYGSTIWQGTGNINKEPLFADPNNSDYHLKSQTGRWDSQSQAWIQDDVTSPCIDTGNPNSEIQDEPTPNGNRINMGFYGGTSQASMSSGETEPNEPDNTGTPAYNPNPSDNSYPSQLNIVLSWNAGQNAVKHDVYLGTDLNAVTNATRENTMGVLKSQGQDNISFDAGTLLSTIPYYWRVDEVLADNTIIKGETWTFTIMIGSKSRACFTAETPVWIDGKMVEISKVIPGQVVGKADSAMSTSGTIKGLEEHSAGMNPCYEMTLESGNTITIVHSHYFMTDSGKWVKIEELSAGMKLQTMNGPITIKSVVKKAKPFLGTSYNLMLNNSEQYFVGKDGVVALDCSKNTWEILEESQQ